MFINLFTFLIKFENVQYVLVYMGWRNKYQQNHYVEGDILIYNDKMPKVQMQYKIYVLTKNLKDHISWPNTNMQ